MRIAFLVALLLVPWLAAGVEESDERPQDSVAAVEELLVHAQLNAERKDELARQALERIRGGLAQSEDDPVVYARWLHNLWYYHLIYDNHAAASSALELALDRLSETDHASGLRITTLNDLSYSLILLGQVAEAKAHLRHAVVLAREQDNDLALADLYYSLADAYRKTGELRVARRYFEADSELQLGSPDQSRAMTTRLKLGSLARDEGNIQGAINQHIQVHDYYEGLVNSLDEADGADRIAAYRMLVTKIELARDYLAAADPERAIHYATQAADDRSALVEQQIDAGIVLLRAMNDRRSMQGSSVADVAEAERMVRKIDALLRGSIDDQQAALARPIRQVRFAAEAIRHHSATGNLDEVSRVGNRAIWLVREVASSLQQHNEDFLAWMAEAQPTLNEYVRSWFILNRTAVFDVLEDNYGYGIALSTLRSSELTGGAIEAREIELFNEYLAAESALVDATAEANTRRETVVEARTRTDLTLLERRRDFAKDAYLAEKDPFPDQEMGFVGSTTVADAARATIAAGDLYLRYFVHEDVSFVAALGQGEPSYHELPPRSAVRRLVDQAHDAIQDGQTDRKTLHRDLATLAKLLPPDLGVVYPDTKRLIIAPDDAVHLVPFSAINLAPDDSRYTPLVDRYEVLRTSSASSYYSARQEAHPEANPEFSDIVIFADPVFATDNTSNTAYRQAAVSQWASQLERLPYTAREARDIAKIFSSRTVQAYLGDDATGDVLLSRSARGAKVLHIATHGYFDETTPGIVGIATSPGDVRNGNGFLSLTELLNQPFFSSLVIVSGCDTLRGKHYRGQSVQSIAQGFMARGAGSVIGTLWKVPDRATSMFMHSFYTSLHENGGNSSQALQAAKREFASSRLYTNPVYWAGFVLDSSNRRVDQKVL